MEVKKQAQEEEQPLLLIPSSQQTMTNDSAAAAKTISRLGKQEAHPYTSIKNHNMLQENNDNASHHISQSANIGKEQILQLQGEENRPQHNFQDESNNTSSKKDNGEKEVMNEREEAKRRIFEEDPDVSKHTGIHAIITGRTKNTQSHRIRNCICNTRTIRRNGKTIEEK